MYIRQIVSRLVAKAPQLIGSVKTGFNYNIILATYNLLKVTSQLTLRKVGCTSDVSLMVGSRSIEFKVAHGKLAVLELD